jgi:hypothetical protein
MWWDTSVSEDLAASLKMEVARSSERLVLNHTTVRHYGLKDRICSRNSKNTPARYSTLTAYMGTILLPYRPKGDVDFAYFTTQLTNVTVHKL